MRLTFRKTRFRTRRLLLGATAVAVVIAGVVGVTGFAHAEGGTSGGATSGKAWVIVPPEDNLYAGVIVYTDNGDKFDLRDTDADGFSVKAEIFKGSTKVYTRYLTKGNDSEVTFSYDLVKYNAYYMRVCATDGPDYVVKGCSPKKYLTE